MQESQFLKEFINNPLVARQYFYNLSSQEKADFIEAFDSPNVKKSLRSLTDEELPRSEAFDNLEDEEKKKKQKEILENKLKDLQNYKKLANIQLTEIIGKMNLLTEVEVNQLLARVSIEDLAYLLPYLEGERARSFIQSLNEDDKQNLLKHLMNANRTGIQEDRLKKLSENFSRDIETIAKNIFVNTKTKDSLSELILEEVKESKQVVNDIGKTDSYFLEKYKHYTYDQEDLVAEESEPFERFIEEVENETIALASFVMDERLRDKIKNSLPPQRMEFVQSIINAKRNGLKRTEATDAFRNFINQYRFQKSNEMTAAEF